MKCTPRLLCQLRVQLSGCEHQLQPLRLRLSDPARFTANNQRLFEISDVVRNPQSFEVLRSSFSDSQGLEVEWADGLSSTFSCEWLQHHLNGAKEERYLWNGKFRKFLPEVAYSELSTETGKGLLSSHLNRYGIALLRDVPCEEGMVVEVGNSIGHVRTTNYGELFDVIDRGNEGNNLAQTNCQILAHTDNPYRDPFPGIQLLHCLQAANEGGATSFTDGFAAAMQLRERDPQAFDLLSRHRHPYEYRDPTQNVVLRAEVPVLSLDAQGHMERISFNNRSAGVLNLPPGELEAYYRAWAAFDGICNDEANVMKVRLSPGDLIIWSNGRVMHGREEYTPGAGRHIQGCYIDHDAVHSRASWATSKTGVNGDAHGKVADEMLRALETQGSFCYGEGCNMLQHALQAAQCAKEQGEPRETILAALMHDVGNAPQARAVWEAAGNPPAELMISPSDNSIGYRHHAKIGEEYVASLGFAAEVVGAVGLHVSAKRALVTMDPSYMNQLSQASLDTLGHQGGPMSPDELSTFLGTPGSDMALRLRRYDDEGKVPDAEVPQLNSYRQLIYEHLRDQSRGTVSTA